MLGNFWQGILMGFSIAMPVGPIAILCIRNSLSYGMRGGLASGLGAAFADLIYGAIAILALEAVLDFIGCHLTFIRLGGALVLSILGLMTMRAAPFAGTVANEKKGLITLFVTTCLLTLTNPMTLFAFMAIYAALGISCAGWFPDMLLLMAGLFIGSAIWWLILSYAASHFKSRVNAEALKWVHRISGALILAFGLFAFFYVL